MVGLKLQSSNLCQQIQQYVNNYKWPQTFVTFNVQIFSKKAIKQARAQTARTVFQNRSIVKCVYNLTVGRNSLLTEK